MKSGSLVETFVRDGVLHSSCVQLRTQYKAAYHHSLEADAVLQHGVRFLNDLTHWHVSASCVFRLAHGGFQEGALEFTEDKFLLHSAGLALESLQQLCAAGWPGLLLDTDATAYRRLAPAFPLCREIRGHAVEMGSSIRSPFGERSLPALWERCC